MMNPKPKADDLFEAGGSVRRQDPQPASAPPRDSQPVETDDGARGRSKKSRAPARAKRKKPEPAREVVTLDPNPAEHKVVAIPEAPQPVNLLSLIGQAIVNPAIDAAKLTALVDWYDKREAKNAYDRDFLAMAPKLPVVERDGLIDQGITRSGRQGVKARYPRYESVHEAVAPVINEFGFTFQTKKAIFGEKPVVIVRLNHYDARVGSYYEESVEEIVRDESGGKTAVQAYASGEQYAIRRAVIKLLHLRSKDPRDRDLDGNDPAKIAAAEAKAKEDAKPINSEQLRELRTKIALTNGRITDIRVCEKAGVGKLEDIPMVKLIDLYKALDNVIEAARG